MNSTSLRSECGDLGPALQQTPEGQKQRRCVTKKQNKTKNCRDIYDCVCVLLCHGQTNRLRSVQ